MTGLLLVPILTLVYGTRSVGATIFPLSGMAVYRASNYGPLGSEGRNFWHPPGANWRWYAGNPTGIWLLGSIWLLANAVFSGFRIFRTREATQQDELILTSALLHLAIRDADVWKRRFMDLLFSCLVDWNRSHWGPQNIHDHVCLHNSHVVGALVVQGVAAELDQLLAEFHVRSRHGRFVGFSRGTT